MKKLWSVLPALAIICASATPGFGADIVATAATDGSFKTFVKAVQQAGLADTLKSAGPFTIFAPTDGAFAKLPDGALNAMLKDKVRLAKVLTYHIIPGRILVAEFKPGKTKTVQGDMLNLASDNGKITVDNANVIQSDIVADNGVIQAIDTVLLPPE